MRIIYLISIIFILLIPNEKLLRAQTVNCDECSSLPWLPANPPYYMMNVNVQSNGSVDVCRVTYQKRVCNGIFEIKIVSLQISPSNLQLNSTLSRIYKAILTSIIRTNSMGFPAAPNPAQHSYWRIIQGSCWHYTGADKTILSPCSTECCVTTVDVFMECGQKHFQVVKEIGVPQCPEDGVGPSDPTDCIYICDPYRDLNY